MSRFPMRALARLAAAASFAVLLSACQTGPRPVSLTDVVDITRTPGAEASVSDTPATAAFAEAP